MADRKISEMLPASDVVATDFIPIVSSGANKRINVGVLTSNLPNIGNKGITKNVPVVGTQIIQLTSTVVKLSVPIHDLPSGTEGQEVTIVGSGSNTVTLSGAGGLTSITFPTIGSTCTLIYIGLTWYVKSYFSVTFA